MSVLSPDSRAAISHAALCCAPDWLRWRHRRGLHASRGAGAADAADPEPNGMGPRWRCLPGGVADTGDSDGGGGGRWKKQLHCTATTVTHLGCV